MHLPIKFATEAEVIAADVARFRALSPEQRLQNLDEMLSLYHFLSTSAARPEVLARLARQDEESGRMAIQEFVRRHG